MVFYCTICECKKDGFSLNFPIPEEKRKLFLDTLINCSVESKERLTRGVNKKICSSHAPGYISRSYSKLPITLSTLSTPNSVATVETTTKLQPEKKKTERFNFKFRKVENSPRDVPVTDTSATFPKRTYAMRRDSGSSIPLPNKLRETEEGSEWTSSEPYSQETVIFEESETPNFDDTYFVVSGKKLKELVTIGYDSSCACSSGKTLCGTRKSTVAAVILHCTRCRNTVKWNSFESSFEGDQQHKFNWMFPMAALTAGLPYQRLYFLATTMNMALPSPSTNRRVLRRYGWKAVDVVHERDQRDTLNRIREKYGEEIPVIDVEGDGQYDTPGYCALMHKFSLFERLLGLCILSITLDKREEGCPSTALELKALQMCIAAVASLKLKIRSLTTDKSSSVGKYMRETHGPSSPQPIIHYLDFWHIAKNFNSKLIKELKLKRNAPLINWRQSIINYLYIARENAGGDPQKMREILLGMLHHVHDVHNWKQDKQFTVYKKCGHARHDRSLTYLVPQSAASNTITELVDENFISSMCRTSPTGSTSRVECFHSMSLMFTPKNKFACKEVYKNRTKLAILRYNWLRKAELDGHRTVTRIEMVQRKYRTEKSRKKVRKGGEDHGWAKEILKETEQEKKNEWAARTQSYSSESESDETDTEFDPDSDDYDLESSDDDARYMLAHDGPGSEDEMYDSE